MRWYTAQWWLRLGAVVRCTAVVKTRCGDTLHSSVAKCDWCLGSIPFLRMRAYAAYLPCMPELARSCCHVIHTEQPFKSVFSGLVVVFLFFRKKCLKGLVMVMRHKHFVR